MTKYIFTNNRLKHTPYNHAVGGNINGVDYDIIVRLIILEKEGIIYIRINDFTPYQGLEYKQVEYQFEQNLKACEAYLRRNYKKYKVYNSYSINKLTDRLQRDILNS